MKTKYIKVAFEECKKGAKAISYKPIMASNLASYDKEIIHLIEVPDHEAELLAELKNARGVIGKLKRSIAVHPDCTENSEFDDYSTIAQECEEEIETLIQKLKSDES